MKVKSQSEYDTDIYKEPHNVKFIEVPATIFVSISSEFDSEANMAIFNHNKTENVGSIDLDPSEILNKIDPMFFEENEQGDFVIDGHASFEDSDGAGGGTVHFQADNSELSNVRISVPVDRNMAANFILKGFGKRHPLYNEYISENAPANTGEPVDENPDYFNQDEMETRYFKRLDFIKSKVEDLFASVSSLFDAAKNIPEKTLKSVGIKDYIDYLTNTENINTFEYWIGNISGERMSKMTAKNKRNIIESQIFNKLFRGNSLKEINSVLAEPLSQAHKALEAIESVIKTFSRDDIRANVNIERFNIAIKSLSSLANKYIKIIENIYNKIGNKTMASGKINLSKVAEKSINDHLNGNPNEISRKILNDIGTKLLEAGVKPPFGIKGIRISQIDTREDDLGRSNPAILKPGDRKMANDKIHEVLKQTYFNGVPLDAIFDSLKSIGIVPLQEDNTRWDGLLVGREGQANIRLGFDESSNTSFEYPFPEETGGLTTYQPIENAMLVLTWHKMEESGRYEVIGYIS